MAVTFRGQALFGDGPTRFVMGPAGRTLLRPFSGDNFSPVSVDGGAAGFLITQTGRLVGVSAAAVWTLFDGLRAEAESGMDGTLVDDTSTNWAGLRMVRFEATAPIERRGDEWSLAYEAEYREVEDAGG